MQLLVIPDHRQQWAYLPLPKCGCSSVKRAIERHFGLEPIEQIHARGWEDAPPLSEGSQFMRTTTYFRWTVVRHPLSRLISTWAEKCYAFPADQAHLLGPDLRAVYGKSFTEFVAHVLTLDVNSEATDSHIRTQASFLVENGELLVDKMLRLESIGTEWPKMQALYGLPDLPWENTSPTELREQALVELTDEMRAMLVDHYKASYELLGYEP